LKYPGFSTPRLVMVKHLHPMRAGFSSGSCGISACFSTLQAKRTSTPRGMRRSVSYNVVLPIYRYFSRPDDVNSANALLAKTVEADAVVGLHALCQFLL